LPGAALAQSEVHPMVSSKYALSLGVFFPSRTIDLRAGVNVAGPENEVDFTKSLGIDRKSEEFEADFLWRFGEKWSMSGQYFRSSSQKNRSLDEDVNWNDVVFEEGSFVRGETELTLFRVFLGRSFGSDERVEAGIGAGIHWLELGAAIKGEIRVGEGLEFREEAVAAKAPLPNIGAWYRRSLSPRWALQARADWFSANIDEFDGGLLNLSVGAEYKLFRNAALGVAFNKFELDAGVDNSLWSGEAKVGYDGPYAYLSVYW
jgi:hypothetical protein